MCDTFVHGVVYSVVFLRAPIWEMFFILVYDIETAIIAASVDDDMFGVFLRILIYDAFYRLFQSAFIVIVDGDDGKFFHGFLRIFALQRYILFVCTKS